MIRTALPQFGIRRRASDGFRSVDMVDERAEVHERFLERLPLTVARRIGRFRVTRNDRETLGTGRPGATRPPRPRRHHQALRYRRAAPGRSRSRSPFARNCSRTATTPRSCSSSPRRSTRSSTRSRRSCTTRRRRSATTSSPRRAGRCCTRSTPGCSRTSSTPTAQPTKAQQELADDLEQATRRTRDEVRGRREGRRGQAQRRREEARRAGTLRPASGQEEGGGEAGGEEVE